MTKKGVCWMVVALLMSAVVAAPVAAAERRGRVTASPEVGLAVEIGVWVGGWRGMWEGMPELTLDPHRLAVVSGKHGHTIDPNGLARDPMDPASQAEDSQSDATDGDHGHTIDPNG